MVKRYNHLDSLRGIAAIMVLIGHYLSLFPYLRSNLMHSEFGSFISIIWNGHSAVILFFLLSGFVLSLPFYSADKIEYHRYLIKRVCRIYIPYVVTIFQAITLKIILHSKIGSIPGLVDWAVWNVKTSFNAIMNHLTFLGEYNSNTFVMVIWSLVHEMRISIIFPFVVLMLHRLDWKLSTLLSLVLSAVSFILIKVIPTQFNIQCLQIILLLCITLQFL
ncbi:acyltransferase family protein [Neobacillus sp. BF23-41]|uniref:acyltransferase family protein n=1 Tax=Neobacillus sp. BF23-41 TaxID=3240280 RepID=UPI0034E43768